MKSARADIGRAAWTEEQKRALDGAFRTVEEHVGTALLLRGTRVTVQAIVGASLSLVIRVPFMPRSVIVLQARQPTQSYSTPALMWTVSATEEGAFVEISDPLGLVPAIGTTPTTFDVFLERS